jgi:Bacterial archaeo-eukaryotic release factor family 10
VESTKELQQLAKFSSGTFPVVSVHVRLPWADQPQPAEGAAFLARHLRQARALPLESEAARQSLKHDLARLEQWREALRSDTSQVTAVSVALFACSRAEVWVEFPSPIPFENEFTIGDRPALRQLARLDADYTNALVVLIDEHSARVCEVILLGGLLTEVSFRREAAEFATQGGQLRYRRQVRDDAQRHYAEVAAHVAAYCTERPETYLILSGQDEILEPFRQLLPPHAQHKIIDTVPLDQRDTHDCILRVARATLEQHERKEDQETVQLLLDSAAGGGLGVLGLPDTLVAVNAGLVHKLIMSSDFQQPGWRCQDCDYVETGAQMPPRCTICNGTVMAVELGEAMVTEVLRHDGLVEPVAPDPRLATHDGIGALLRHL